MATKRAAARASAVEDVDAPRKTNRRNRKAENRFSHATSDARPEPAKPRAHPSLQTELIKRGITIAELTERAHNFDNNVTTADADRIASAIVAYLSKLTAKNRRVQWCVIPGFVFDSRKSESAALISEGWAGYQWTYLPEEYVAVSSDFAKLEQQARDRLLKDVEHFPKVKAWVQAMGTSWEPKSADEATAREMVTTWLITRATARR